MWKKKKGSVLWNFVSIMCICTESNIKYIFYVGPNKSLNHYPGLFEVTENNYWKTCIIDTLISFLQWIRSGSAEMEIRHGRRPKVGWVVKPVWNLTVGFLRVTASANSFFSFASSFSKLYSNHHIYPRVTWGLVLNSAVTPDFGSLQGEELDSDRSTPGCACTSGSPELLPTAICRGLICLSQNRGARAHTTGCQLLPPKQHC